MASISQFTILSPRGDQIITKEVSNFVDTLWTRRVASRGGGLRVDMPARAGRVRARAHAYACACRGADTPGHVRWLWG